MKKPVLALAFVVLVASSLAGLHFYSSSKDAVPLLAKASPSGMAVEVDRREGSVSEPVATGPAPTTKKNADGGPMSAEFSAMLDTYIAKANSGKISADELKELNRLLKVHTKQMLEKVETELEQIN